MSDYVIITPAHNEEAFIEKTINGVVSQTVKPLKWVIVNDGSTDKTGEIVEKYARSHEFIHYVSLRRDGGRSFGRKAVAFNHGVTQLAGAQFEFVGNLDADIKLEPRILEDTLASFNADPTLGIAGGIVFTTIDGRFVTQDKNPNSVAGAIQLFRKKCFEDVGGGYLSLPYGGIDAAAEFIAKRKGWKVKKSISDKVYEQRQTGTASMTPISACYQLGRRFHSLGYGLTFYVVRCVYRIGDEPVILGSCACLLGFLESLIKRRPVLLPDDVAGFLRTEHRKRLLQGLMPWIPKRVNRS